MVTAASRFLRYIPEDPMSGPDVQLVQRRLRELGFYQGALDGVFGRGTHDAVRAFQARRGLPVDGVVGPSTYTALGSGPTPQALGTRGPVLTIDLERRKLFFARNNVTQKSYDVAVGAPDTPTPVGRWIVVEKSLDPGGPFGTRWIRLNIPWGGYGIHGTDDLASIGNAVSHGCVRMHNRDVEELYDRVPLGTMVNIIGQVFTGRVLAPGATGTDVRAIQELLRLLGFFAGDVSGTYDEAAAEAVRHFQRSRGLAPDAVVGPATYDALLEAFDTQRGSVEP